MSREHEEYTKERTLSELSDVHGSTGAYVISASPGPITLLFSELVCGTALTDVFEMMTFFYS
ncbi:hypothetical protein BPOR_0341g00080 [Botrytis porri]|uniref:Uncharacterized protein n=1 Tax=Botrytis porri TaxID=87229 RepID=A0A4Z1KJ01_9HELO|nr:hypothetical protein BPOR_0341g00080 [Botrytis porri]